jgi:hypothetical protein
MIDKYYAQTDEWKAQWEKLAAEDPFKNAVEMERLEQLITDTLRQISAALEDQGIRVGDFA